MSIATNESWTDKNGQKQEKTEWHRLVVFGKLAELCGQYLTKGRQIYTEGKLQTRQWQDKDGQTRYTTEVVAQSIQFLGGGNANAGQGANQGAGNYASGGNNNGAGAYSGSAGAQLSNNQPPQYNADNAMPTEPTFTEEDVPF